MQILLLLGAVVIIAAIALVFVSGGAEKNQGIANFLSKLKGLTPENFQQAGRFGANPDKYEKSDDGKVVYAFKQKDGEGGDDDSKDDSGNEDA